MDSVGTSKAISLMTLAMFSPLQQQAGRLSNVEILPPHLPLSLSTVFTNMQNNGTRDELAKNLPGQCVSRSGFLAVVEVCVGEPSSDCGMRGLSTNFAFRRGAGSRMHTHTHTHREGDNMYTHTHTQRSGRWRKTRKRGVTGTGKKGRETESL